MGLVRIYYASTGPVLFIETSLNPLPAQPPLEDCAGVIVLDDSDPLVSSVTAAADSYQVCNGQLEAI